MASAPAPRWKARLLKAAADAEAAGWEPMPGSPNTLRRLTTRTTPDYCRANGWWSPETYEHVESLTFVTYDGRIPKVVHRVHRSPWTTATDRFISFRAALDILALPRSR